MIKNNLVTLASLCEVLAAGNNFKSNGENHGVFKALVEEGGETINESAPLYPHFNGCLGALEQIAGSDDYKKARTYSEFARIILRDWETVKSNTYAYRAAADCFKMMAGDN